jgi:pimeloyl-ACP methyl ester carboxylesterase
MTTARWRGPLAAALALAALAPTAPAVADTVTLKSGVAYHGQVDVDDTLVSIFDGLSRVVVRDTKIAKTVKEAEPKYEVFRPVQPLEVHGGVMPVAAYSIKASPWDKYGRRQFEYLGPKSTKPVKMTQAINVLGPKSVHIRGVNGYWQSQLPTDQVPKEVVLGLLAQVDQKNLDYRLAVNRFLMQAEWYPEAKKELERLAKDFPDQAERATLVKQSILELEAGKALVEIKTREQAQQPREVAQRLKAFPIEGAPSAMLVEVRDKLRRGEAQAADDKALAEALRKVVDELPAAARKGTKGRLVEILAALSEAPEAVRGRLEPFLKADAKLGAENRFALALSGWIAGPEGAVPDPKSAEALWQARDAVRSYLAGGEAADRQGLIETLQGLEFVDPSNDSTRKLDPDTLTRIVRLMPPPLRDAREEAPGEVKLIRIRDEPNPDQPTEYAVALPPEYHPLRSYPAVVALHGGDGPKSAVAWWAAEAARRGYIVIAPEYNLRGQSHAYRYTPSEHAAVELALRDARRRFAIDGDRVFLGGVLEGGNMAWDYGLGHPDLFAGVAIVSGLPGKYVWAYKDNARRVPLYVAMGDLAPAESAVIFDFCKKNFIARNYDAVYVEHYQRGLEDMPEECPAIFDWMATRRRDPYPKEFDVVTARECDDRFFGVVIKEFSARRAMDPNLVDAMGKNLRPASLGVQVKGGGTLLVVKADGLRRFDVWVPPKQLDPTKKLEVRILNGRSIKVQAKPSLADFLEDLRLRGDRQQIYGLKIPVNLGGSRPQS